MRGNFSIFIGLRRGFAALLILGLAGVAWAADAPPAPPATKIALLDPGAKLPSMTLLDQKGVSHDISRSETKGGAVGIYFWSVFCPNCKEALPELVRLYQNVKDRGFTLWAVNVDGDRFSNAVLAFLAEAELPFPVVFDRLEGEYLIAADPLGVSKTPTLYLADANGTVLLRQVIEIDVAAAEKALPPAP